ncbi:hypothetical protein ACYBSK_29285 [Streptomyces sp. BYX5S]
MPLKSYAGVWAVNTTAPTLRDTFTDPDGDKVNGTFQVRTNAFDGTHYLGGPRGFASTFRMLDMDGCWVDIDGFQDCDSSADVIKCAQRS